MQPQPVTLTVNTASAVSTKPEVGFSSILGTVAALASGGAAVYAAVKGNDFATATAAGAGVISTVATISSRAAQAVALIVKGAKIAEPYIDAAQAALDAEDGADHPATAGPVPGAPAETSGDERSQSDRPEAT